MRPTAIAIAAALALAAPLAAQAAEVTHFATPPRPGAPGGMSPPFSTAVKAGDTIYIAGTTDGGDAVAKPGEGADAAAKRVMDNIKRSVELAGATMDDLVWVQVFAADLKDYAAFNTVYRTYFKGPMPTRAFIGAGSLLGNAKFEVMGIAVKAK